MHITFILCVLWQILDIVIHTDTLHNRASLLFPILFHSYPNNPNCSFNLELKSLRFLGENIAS